MRSAWHLQIFPAQPQKNMQEVGAMAGVGTATVSRLVKQYNVKWPIKRRWVRCALGQNLETQIYT